MTFQESNQRYEAWLATQIPIIKKDLLLKHDRMAEAAFPFLRATFFRWCELWIQATELLKQELRVDFNQGPQVLGVGDLHLENFGTWRDAEGRLVWGINDFDEACHYPFLFDLIRLAASAAIAIEENHLKFPLREAVEAVFVGYEEGLKAGGAPFILEESHGWLREIATSRLRTPESFWAKLEKLKTGGGQVPADLKPVLKAHLPQGCDELSFVNRVAGLGSLGRERVVALATLNGGMIAREIKPLVTSAWRLAKAGAAPPPRPARGTRRKGSGRAVPLAMKGSEILYGKIIAQARREADPFLFLPLLKSRGMGGAGGRSFVLRRLAPHCIKIEIDSLPRKPDEVRLFESMGFETANIHLGSVPKNSLLAALGKFKIKDLRQLVQVMTDRTREDFRSWRKR